MRLQVNSGGMDISRVSGQNLLWQMGPQWASYKLLQGLVPHELIAYLSVFDLILTHVMVILSKGCEDNFQPHNSLKCSFINIWGLF